MDLTHFDGYNNRYTINDHWDFVECDASRVAKNHIEAKCLVIDERVSRQFGSKD